MRMPLFRKVLSCVMVVMLAAAVFAGDSPAAMLYTNGTTWLNGSTIPKSSAIFSGDLIQTKSDSLAKINASGSSVTVFSDSLIQFQANSVKVEHGAVAVSTAKGMATHAGGVTVTPASLAPTEFDVKDTDHGVQISARKGDVVIQDSTGSSTLPQGQQTTRDDSDSPRSNKKKEAGGALPAATGGILGSRVVIGAGIAAIAGITAWLLVQGDEPVSPSRP
jgi:hypothetical protein